MKKYKQDAEATPEVQEPMTIYSFHNFDDAGIFGIMESVKRGISFDAFVRISQKFPFTIQTWADFLHLSTKTLSRYEKDNKTFEAPQSERIMQIEMLHTKGIEVFGSDEYFMIWLQTESLILGKKKPQDLLDSSFGIALLTDELTRIAHGVLS